MQAIRCGLLPGDSPALTEALNEPLRQWLQQCLGRPVRLQVAASAADTAEALRRGELDLACLDPVSYILQSRQACLQPFARPSHAGPGGPTSRAALIVPAKSPATSLAGLRGGKIGLGDPASATACWVPRYMLLEAGLLLGRDYERHPPATPAQIFDAVARHELAAGGLPLPALQRLVAIHATQADEIRVLALSQPVPESMWTFRAGLAEELRSALRQAFISLRDPDALAAYRAEAFIPAVDADVERVRVWMEALLDARLPLPEAERQQALAVPALAGLHV